MRGASNQEHSPAKKHHAEYVNGKWEPQCPYGDMCTRCDAIGYCERAESRPASEPLPPPRDSGITDSGKRVWEQNQDSVPKENT